MYKLVCVALLLAVVRSGSSLKCISCDSTRNPNCNDPAVVDKLAVSECNTAAATAAVTSAMCMKISVEEKSTGTMNITRKCMVTPKAVDPCKVATTAMEAIHVKLFHCSTCDTDLCNGAATYLPSMALISAILFFLFTLRQ